MSIPKTVGLAIVAAIAVNLLVYFMGTLAGASYIAPQGPDQALAPVPWFAVVGATAMTMVVGTLVYLGLHKLAPGRGWSIFLALAGLVVVGSFIPFAAPTFDLKTKIFLGIMHLTTPAALIQALAKVRGSRGSASA